MARTAEAIIHDVLGLPEGERARVLDVLIDMLGAPDAPTIQELRERRDELASEAVQGIPGADVIRALRRE